MLKDDALRKAGSAYDCWLDYTGCSKATLKEHYRRICSNIVVNSKNPVVQTAIEELIRALQEIMDVTPVIADKACTSSYLFVGIARDVDIHDLAAEMKDEFTEGSFIIKNKELDEHGTALNIIGKDESGVLYGVFHLIKAMMTEMDVYQAETIEIPRNKLRMINHWDNLDGTIERGYAGNSFFYRHDEMIKDWNRIKDYARLLASIGINGVCINNVNVHRVETKLITEEYLPDIASLANVFRVYGIKTFLSINFAAPMELGALPTADPVDDGVREWWKAAADKIYNYIPDFGGFLVKADSENRPGPFTYERTHAEGANLLAEALKPYGGLVIWRCFVYDCLLDWRDRTKDRAKAAYDNFKSLDGRFMDNVVLQVKNGPMDFQIREAVSPLFGAMEKTNMILEFQVTQEYTGQQKHVCYLLPMWKEVLDFDTYAKGKGSEVRKVVDGSLFRGKYGGITAVSNLGDNACWTGHPLAQANFYGLGRIAWNPEFSAEELAEEWTRLTYGNNPFVLQTIVSILMKSREVYEKYTSPLGIGWMVYPHHHYGPSVDGYEYTSWGTYHYADWRSIGVDRTTATGTGFTAQYHEPVSSMYEHIETCPEELLLFFHHVEYTYRLKNGKTLLQHIYDTHFDGVEAVEEFIKGWNCLRGMIKEDVFNRVTERFTIQLKDSMEWRDTINTYFYRRTGIKDCNNRKIYE